MTTPPRLQYTSIRTRVVDGEVLIGLKHTTKAADGTLIKHDWIEMPPSDAARMVDKLREVLADYQLKMSASRPAQ